MKIFGLPSEAWEDIYRIYKFEKQKEPKDLYELYNYWNGVRRAEPMDCFKVAAQLAECKNESCSILTDMIENFILGTSINQPVKESE